MHQIYKFVLKVPIGIGIYGILLCFGAVPNLRYADQVFAATSRRKLFIVWDVSFNEL